MRKAFYVFSAIVGTLLPWAFFGSFFVAEGINLPLFVTRLFENGAAGGFSADVLISIGVFWFWSYGDARRLGIRRWWLVLPASFMVGLSLALPLYLTLREDAATKG